MWDFLKTQGELHGPVFLICLLALGAMGVAVWRLWKRHGDDIKVITELSEQLAKSGKGADEKGLKERHEEVLGLLKKLRFAYSGDGDVMKKLNEILDIEEKLFDAHLGPGAKDEEGRLKWWGASRIEELLGDITERCALRIQALQELRLKEGKQAGNRIDELQELRVAHADRTVREAIEVMKAVTQIAEDIRKVVEDLRSMLMRGGGS